MKLKLDSFHTIHFPGHVYDGKICQISYYREASGDYLVWVLDVPLGLGYVFLQDCYLKPFKLKVIQGEKGTITRDTKVN